MKKALSIFLVLCSLYAAFAAAGYAAEQREKDLSIILQIDNPVMTVNGAEKEIDPGIGTKPVIINDRTLLPVRAVVEEIGGTVEWNGDAQEVTLLYEQNIIRLTINDTTAYLNDESITLDAAPAIINDRTMLPIRFIVESFGYDVAWNGDIQTVTITKAEPQISEPTAEQTVEPEQEPSAEPTVKPEQEPSAEPTSEPADVPDDNEAEESKMLVVYFSATGTTKALAETIAETTGADIIEIVPEVPYTIEDLSYNNDNCRANKEMNDESVRPAIAGSIENIDEYDTIFIGYPIWWGTMPRIINTFLDTYDLSGKTVMPFCTSGGSGIETSVSAIRNTEPDADVKDGLRGSSSSSGSQIENWLENNNVSKNK